MKDGYRLRIGDYRALYRIYENELIIEVIKLGSRGDVYK
ncbi:MAG: type II toxin-antitoxin system RelE/ParE family toxin [Gammaproteobacteria bacterium]